MYLWLGGERRKGNGKGFVALCGSMDENVLEILERRDYYKDCKGEVLKEYGVAGGIFGEEVF